MIISIVLALWVIPLCAHTISIELGTVFPSLLINSWIWIIALGSPIFSFGQTILGLNFFSTVLFDSLWQETFPETHAFLTSASLLHNIPIKLGKNNLRRRILKDILYKYMEINRICTVYMNWYTYHEQLNNLFIYKEGKADINSYLVQNVGRYSGYHLQYSNKHVYINFTSKMSSPEACDAFMFSIKTWVIYRVRSEFIETFTVLRVTLPVKQALLQTVFERPVTHSNL